MRKLLLFVTVALASSRAFAGPDLFPDTEDYLTGSGVPLGGLASRVCTQVANDTSPSMGGATTSGCNVLLTSTSNSGTTALTALDDVLVGSGYGELFYVVGKGGATPTTIANADNFSLESNWTATSGNVLVLGVTTAGAFFEVTRQGGARNFAGTTVTTFHATGAMTADSTFTMVAGSNLYMDDDVSTWYGFHKDSNTKYISATNKLTTTVNTNGDTLTCTDPGAVGVLVTGYHNSASPAVDDVIRRDSAKANNSTPAETEFGKCEWVLKDSTATSEEASYVCYVRENGTLSEYMRLAGADASQSVQFSRSLSLTGTTRTIRGASAITDVAPTVTTFKSSDSYAQASAGAASNGANAVVVGGLAARYFTSVSNVAGAVALTITANGTALATITGSNPIGVNQFALGSDDTAPQLAVTATNLCAYINGSATYNVYVTGTAVGAKCFLQPTKLTSALGIATNQAGRISKTEGVDGPVLFQDGTATQGGLCLQGNQDTCFYRAGASALGISIDGTLKFYVDAGAANTYGVGFNSAGAIQSSSGHFSTLLSAAGLNQRVYSAANAGPLTNGTGAEIGVYLGSSAATELGQVDTCFGANVGGTFANADVAMCVDGQSLNTGEGPATDAAPLAGSLHYAENASHLATTAGYKVGANTCACVGVGQRLINIVSTVATTGKAITFNATLSTCAAAAPLVITEGGGSWTCPNGTSTANCALSLKNGLNALSVATLNAVGIELASCTTAGGGTCSDGIVTLRMLPGTCEENTTDNAGAGVTETESANGAFTIPGSLSIGWSVKAAADTACNTTCVSGCVFGQNTAALTYAIVACDDATADICVCAGAS